MYRPGDDIESFMFDPNVCHCGEPFFSEPAVKALVTHPDGRVSSMVGNLTFFSCGKCGVFLVSI